MTWFLTGLSLLLTIYAIKSTIDYRQREKIQRGSLEALIAVIGEDDNRLDLSKRYLDKLSYTLSTENYETVLQNMSIAAEVRPAFDNNGRVDDITISTLAKAFAEYASNLHTNTKIR